MVADVPVAALLSGGIDSSLVVAAYSQVSTESPRTFNVRFPDPDYDETAVAQAASTRYHTRHETIDLRDWAMSPDLVLGLLAHFDQPFADTSLIPMYWIARAIRERGIICALSGDGGDEAFGGYARFWRANRLVQLMRLPAWVQAATVLTGHHLSRWTRDWGRQIAKAMELAQEGQRDSAPLIAGLSNYLSEKQKSELLRTGACEGLQPVYRHFVGPNPPAARTLEELSRRMTENLFDVALPGDMLRKVDMMSMLASIEVRVPMLDEEMVAVGLRLPHRLKTDGQHGKLVLRGLAERWLPRQVVAHPKHGFDIPLDRLVTERFHEILGDMLLSPGARIRGFLDVAVVERWLAAFKKAGQGFATGTISRGGLYQRIIILLALELWMREHQLSW
jgi:asparagine synthase (glutamine-hydrolysing)